MFTLDLGNLLVHLRLAEEDWTKSVASVEQKFSQVASRMTSIGTRLSVAVTAPLLLMERRLVSNSLTLESAFAGVRKTVDATEKQFAELKVQLDTLSKSIPLTTQEIYGIAEAAGQLGIERTNIIKFTKTMADLGATTNMTAQNAAMSLARFANIMQMPQKEVDRLGSVIVDLGNNLATTEAEITLMGTRLAGAGRLVRMTEAQVMSMAAAFSSVGMEAEAGGTALSKILQDMYTAVMSGNDKLKVFASTAGQTSEEFAKAFRENASVALIEFVEGLGRLHQSGQNVMQVLEAVEMDDRRVARSLLSAAGAGDLLRRSIDMGSRAWEENNALVDEANKRYETNASKIRMLWNTISLSFEKVGNIIAEKLLGFSDKYIKPLLEIWSRLSDTTQEWLVDVLAVAAALGPVILGVALVEKSIGLLIGVMGKLTAPLSLVMGLMGGWVVAALAVGAVAYTLYAVWNQNLSAVKDRMQDLLNAFKAGLSWFLDTPLGEFCASFVSAFYASFRIIKEGFGDFLSDVAGTFAGTKAWIARMADATKEAWSAGTFHQFISDFKQGWKEAGDSWAITFVEGQEKTSKALARLKQETTNTLREVKDVWLPAFGEATAEHWGDLLEALKTQASQDIKAIITHLAKSIPVIQDLMRAINPPAPSRWSSFLDGIKNKAVGVYEKVHAILSLFPLQSGVEGVTPEGPKVSMSDEAIRSAWDKLYGGLNQKSQDYHRFQQERLKKEAELWIDNAASIAKTFNVEKRYVLDLIEAYKKEQRILLDIEELKHSERLVDGFKAAGMQIQREIQTWGERAYEFSMGMVSTFENGLMQMLDDMSNWKNAVKQILREILMEAMRIAYIRPAAQELAGVISAGVQGAVGGLGGAARVAEIPSGTLGASGTGGIHGFQEGGIAWYPQLANVAEKEPELITPFSKIGQLVEQLRQAGTGGKPSPVSMSTNTKIVNVYDQEEALAAMQSDRGEKVILNVLRRKGII